MTVRITLQDTQGKVLGQFEAQDRVSLAQMAISAGIPMPVSCGAGMCGICTCKIISWHEYVQIDKISLPLKTLPRDEQGRFTEIFTCVGGIASEYIKDQEIHEVILEKNI